MYSACRILTAFTHSSRGIISGRNKVLGSNTVYPNSLSLFSTQTQTLSSVRSKHSSVLFPKNRLSHSIMALSLHVFPTSVILSTVLVVQGALLYSFQFKESTTSILSLVNSLCIFCFKILLKEAFK